MNDTEKFLFDLQGLPEGPRLPHGLPKSMHSNAAFDANEDKRGEDGNHNTGGSGALAGRRRGMFTGDARMGKTPTACPSAPCWRTESSFPTSTRSLAVAGRWITRPLCSAAARVPRA